jgi:hypothetical protein
MLECGEQWAPLPAVKRIMAASIPGVACRTLIDNIPVLSAHRQKATQQPPGTATLPTRRTATLAWPSVMRRRRESSLCHDGAFVCATMRSTSPKLMPGAPSSFAVAPSSFAVAPASAVASCCLQPAASGKKQRHPPAAPSAR